MHCRSSKIAMKRVEPEAEAALLDLESLSGSAEITFKVAQGQSLDQQVQLGVKLQLPSVGDMNPTHIVHLIPRYIVINKSAKAICVCQDGFQACSHHQLLRKLFHKFCKLCLQELLQSCRCRKDLSLQVER